MGDAVTRAVMGRFLEACGATRPLELVVDEAASGRPVGRWALPQPFAILGRDPGAEISLPHELISFRHAYIQVVRGRIFVIDLESRTGLSWGGRRATSGWLDPGSALEVGPYRVRPAEARSGRAAGPLAAGSPGRGLRRVYLEFPDLSTGPARIRLRGTVTLVGRSPGCGLQIADSTVSRHHAAMVRTPKGLWVVDLRSREGIRVDGQPVRWALLEEGTTLRIGRFRAVVRFPDASGRVGTQADPPTGSSFEVLAVGGALPVPDAPPAAPAPTPPVPPALMAASAPAPAQLALPDGAVVPAGAVIEPLISQFGLMQQQMFDQFHQAMMAMFQMFGNLHREQMAQVQQELEQVREITRQLQELQAESAAAPASRGAPAPAPAQAPGAPAAPLPSPAPAPPGPDDLRRVAHDLSLHASLCERIAALQDERQNRWQKILSLVSGGARN